MSLGSERRLAWTIGAFLLAGCVDAPAIESLPTQIDETATDSGPVGQTQETTNTSLTADDPGWNGKSELVLFDGRVQTVEVCYAPFGFDDGVLVLAGTKRLRVSADASDALKAGRYHFDLQLPPGEWKPNHGTDHDTDQKIHEWAFELGPSDWDRAGSARSQAKLSFECEHTVLPWPYGGGVLYGTIDVTITAERGTT